MSSFTPRFAILAALLSTMQVQSVPPPLPPPSLPSFLPTAPLSSILPSLSAPNAALPSLPMPLSSVEASMFPTSSPVSKHRTHGPSSSTKHFGPYHPVYTTTPPESESETSSGHHPAPTTTYTPPDQNLKRRRGQFKRRMNNGEDEQKDGGVPGTIDITGQNSTRLGSLFLGIANSTSSFNSTSRSNEKFVLNVSSTNQTTIYLVNSNTTLNTTSLTYGITLQIPVFDTTCACMVRYCTTFNSFSSPERLTVEPCFELSSNTTHSQQFVYDSDNGMVEPVWADGKEHQNGEGDAKLVFRSLGARVESGHQELY